MKQRIIIIISILSFVLNSCITKTWFKPKRFTYQYENKDTGLDRQLDIDGFFTGDTMYMHLNGDLDEFFKLRKELHGVAFLKRGLVCHLALLSDGSMAYKVWGNYVLDTDTIKTQVLIDLGIDGLGVNKRFYYIRGKRDIMHIGYISYHDLYFEQAYELWYVPLTKEIDTSKCWLLNKGWFYK